MKEGDAELNAASRIVTRIAVPPSNAATLQRRAERARRFLLARSESGPECARGEAIASQRSSDAAGLDWLPDDA